MTDVFAIKDYSFPKDFLWGSATAAHQVEGNNIHSDSWFNEHKKLKMNPDYEVSGTACNHYNMYEEDAALLKDLGHQAFRLGVEWARIEPDEGVFLDSEAEHYVRELACLKEKGIQTFVTLVHFSLPKWFSDKGGFNSLDNLKYFEKYLNYILPKISPYVDFWNVWNECNGDMTVDKFDFKFNAVIYHARGYHLIKQFSNKPVSSAISFVYMHAKRQNDVFDKTMEKYYDMICHEYLLHAIRTGELVVPHKDGIFDREIKGTMDFWSVNSYTRNMVDARSASLTCKRYPFSETRMLPMNFYLDEFYPECIYHNLMRLTDKPIYITENGCSCHNDDFRMVYLAEYLCALNQAIKDGADVKGYLYWSFLDNYEWWTYIPKFGLVDVDRKNGFKRTPKPSAYFYRDIIRNNGFSQEILSKYLKEMPRVDRSMPILK